MIQPLDEDLERAIWRTRLLETLSSPALPAWLVVEEREATDDDCRDPALIRLAQRLRRFFER